MDLKVVREHSQLACELLCEQVLCHSKATLRKANIVVRKIASNNKRKMSVKQGDTADTHFYLDLNTAFRFVSPLALNFTTLYWERLVQCWICSMVYIGRHILELKTCFRNQASDKIVEKTFTFMPTKWRWQTRDVRKKAKCVILFL